MGSLFQWHRGSIQAWVGVLSVLWVLPLAAQQNTPQFSNPQSAATGNPQQGVQQDQQPQQPDFPELRDPKHEQFVNQLLNYWQQSSGQIKRYEFDFQRWIYSPQFCKWRDPANQKLAAATLARGSVRFQAPDKGMYEVHRGWRFNGTKEKTDDQGRPVLVNGQPVLEADYQEITNDQQAPARERWICDGQAIYEYDFENKRIYETTLPADMQGEGLKKSPIPFLFGIQAEEMRNRFWIRVLPSNDDNVFVLEAHPKWAEDRQNYKKLVISLSREPFLPLQLEMYAANYDPQTNQSYTVFSFENRQVNDALSAAQQWLGNFVKPSIPNWQWKMVQRQGMNDAASNAASGALPRTGQLPTNGGNK